MLRWSHYCALWWGVRQLQNVYSNLYSQAVTHPSTNRSQPCLTSVNGRELVYSRWYGRRHCNKTNIFWWWSRRDNVKLKMTGTKVPGRELVICLQTWDFCNLKLCRVYLVGVKIIKCPLVNSRWKGRDRSLKPDRQSSVMYLNVPNR